MGAPGQTSRLGKDPLLARLESALAAARTGGLGSIEAERLAELPRLYRYAATRLSGLETSGGDPARAAELRALLSRAHALLFEGLDRDDRAWFTRAKEFFLGEVPETIRAEWRPIALSFLIVYGLAVLSYCAVYADLDRAWSLLDPGAVANEIQQLQATTAGEPFRGNFTFGLGDSPLTAGAIMTHNMSVGILFFAAALVPPLYLLLLAINGLMLGTYTAVAAHWGQGLAISSILWCHGTLEIQAFVLAGAAGLVLVRGLVAPGPWSRRHALRLSAARSVRLIAPVFPILFCAGLIEGFVTPNVGLVPRIATAVVTGTALIAWAVLGRRRATSAEVPRTVSAPDLSRITPSARGDRGAV